MSEIVDSSTSGMDQSSIQEYPSLDYDNGSDIKSVSAAATVFEFQKTEKEKATQRMPVRSFSKPAPSKWDDAQKWIASPTANRPKTGQITSKKGPSFGRQSSIKVLEVAGVEEPDTKRVDVSQVRKDSGGHKFVSWEEDSFVKPVLMESATGGVPLSVSFKLFNCECSLCIF